MTPRFKPCLLCLLFVALAAGCGGSSSSSTDGGADGTSDPPIDPGHPGAACRTDADCLFDGSCFETVEGFPGGYCTIPDCQPGTCPDGSTCFEFTDGVSRCLAACTDDSDCRSDHGYVCDADDTCWPGPGAVVPGGPCAASWQCMGAENALCHLEGGFLDGYCIIVGCAPSCPGGTACREILSDGSTGCVSTCGSDEECRLGYVCNQEPGSALNGVCIPGCTAGACPDPTTCVETDLWSGHFCLDITHLCGPENTGGDCPAGQVCSDAGACVPFECDDSILEPNQDIQQAQPLPAVDTEGVQICEGDEDWFSFAPVVANVLHQVGIDYNLASGDLEIHLLDAQENLVDKATLKLANIHEENPVGTVNNESLALVAVPGSEIHYVRVFGLNGAVNDYSLLSKTIDFQDGPVCTDLYDLESCRAKAADGSDDFSQLIPFPAPQPLDPLIGDGVFFDHGLSGGAEPTHHSSSMRWSRRELIMLVRNAIHEVQVVYPGTARLAVGDVCLRDGRTPGGHPNHTHDDGRNVDLAYYIKPEYHRQWGNLAYRQICCDAEFLFDYSCVDLDEESDEYGTCLAGSELTHIVDIPRTALLLAKLATGDRLSAAGVDTKLVPELKAELARLRTEETISQQEYDSVMANLLSAEDHPSWIWHFHHMHISLCDGDCDDKSTRSLARGPWSGLTRAELRSYLQFWLPRDLSRLTPR